MKLSQQLTATFTLSELQYYSDISYVRLLHAYLVSPHNVMPVNLILSRQPFISVDNLEETDINVYKVFLFVWYNIYFPVCCRSSLTRWLYTTGGCYVVPSSFVPAAGEPATRQQRNDRRQHLFRGLCRWINPIHL